MLLALNICCSGKLKGRKEIAKDTKNTEVKKKEAVRRNDGKKHINSVRFEDHAKKRNII